MSIRRRKLLYWSIGAVAAVLTAAVIYAPYLPRLLYEGYPQALWPAPGSYARVAGGGGTPPPAASRLAQPEPKLHSLFSASEGRALLAMKDGRLVMETYAPGIDRETRLNSYSLVKSLVGALTLKAIAEGRIPARDVPLGQFIPEFREKPLGNLPLCRLLDMRSGIVFEPGAKKAASGPELKDLEATKLNLLGPMGRLHMTGLAGIMDRLVRQAPDGQDIKDCASGHYSYQNVNTALTGALLERIYGSPLADILSEKIWRPSGAADAHWRLYAEGLPVTPYCCLFARPMDWLLVARFLLENGTPAEPFLPPDLWQQLMGLDVPAAALHTGHYANFGYHNILDKPGEALAGPFTYFFGSRGQAVYMMPREKLAVVRFGNKIQLLHSTLYGAGRSLAAP